MTVFADELMHLDWHQARKRSSELAQSRRNAQYTQSKATKRGESAPKHIDNAFKVLYNALIREDGIMTRALIREDGIMTRA